MLRIYSYILLFFILIQSTTSANTNLLFVGDKINKHIYINSQFIAENSDTLILNNKILQRNSEYRFNKTFKRFELLVVTNDPNDSLIVKYRLLPSWLKQKYGKELPQITPESKTATIILPTDIQRESRPNSDMSLSGSKSFRFSTSKSGSQGFNQTLDLNLSGHLANNLTLKGTISDRGYNPSYGSSNSRLNELDKINLTVESPNFKAQIGDFVIGESNNKRSREKKISGLNLLVHNKNVQVGMIAARPKGQYQSIALLGINKKQGPYQIISQGIRQAIIPGSETIWLDGVEMKRGATADYIFDYPNGQITFNVNHIIDARSRILVDYEPLSSEYKQEYLHANSKLSFSDSTLLFSFDWIREGDDKDENLSQTFSTTDKDILANLSGIETIYKSGLLSDTLGDYELISDSLPDTVYFYVGDKLGSYDVRFSFVDTGKGDYTYLGGNQYQYVGSGSGDYLPIILLNTPKRTDYLKSSFIVANNSFGNLQAEWSQSRNSNNLFAIDNSTINKNYYYFTYDKSLLDSQNKINVRYSKKEFGYSLRNRFNKADYKYQFYLPVNNQYTADEQLTSVDVSLKPHRMFVIIPKFSRLDYSNQFQSNIKSVALSFNPSARINFSGNILSVKTDLQDSTNALHGNSDKIHAKFNYKFYKNYRVTSFYKKTERTNNYELAQNGFAHNEYTVKLADNHSELSYQYYTEDTLSLFWDKKLDRKRIQLKSENRIKQINYKLQIYYQETDGLLGEQTSLLSRANLIYSNRKHNLQIQTSYVLSEETRFSKGIRYLEVNDGEGDYIFADSQFVPEAGGNYILVEELLSDSAPVKRGEKTFSLTKKWSKVYLRFTSTINEELFASESRSNKWIIPIYSDSKLSYLFFNRFTKGSIRAFPISGGYFLTVNFSEKKESRFINQQDRLKESLNTEFIFNQNANQLFIEEKIEIFNDKRDAYYSRAGDVGGFAASGKVKRVTSHNEYAVQLKFRSALSSDSKKSQIFTLLLENRFRLKKHGELNFQTEFYKSNKNNLSVAESYLITNNRPGSQGAIWSVIFRAKIKKELRLNFTIQGRHSDINQARIFARTEFIAQF